MELDGTVISACVTLDAVALRVFLLARQRGLRPTDVGRGDGADVRPRHVATEVRVHRHRQAERLRHGEHPLANVDVGEDPVHKMRGGLRHLAAAAGRTEGAALARERQDHVRRAGRAADTSEAERGIAALEERLELLEDVRRQGAAAMLVLEIGQESIEVGSDDLLEY